MKYELNKQSKFRLLCGGKHVYKSHGRHESVTVRGREEKKSDKKGV